MKWVEHYLELGFFYEDSPEDSESTGSLDLVQLFESLEKIQKGEGLSVGFYVSPLFGGRTSKGGLKRSPFIFKLVVTAISFSSGEEMVVRGKISFENGVLPPGVKSGEYEFRLGTAGLVPPEGMFEDGEVVEQ